MVVVNIPPKKEFVRPLIEEMPYLGKCVEIDELKDAEGNAKINVNAQYKKENVPIKFVFALYDLKTGQEIRTEEGVQVKLAQFAPYKSRDQGDEEWNVIIGNKKARITPILSALGMEFKSDQDVNYDLNNLVGKQVKLYVKDHTKKNPDGTEETFSVINDISPLNQKDIDKLSKSTISEVNDTDPKKSVVENSDGEEIETIDLSGEESNKKGETEIEKKTRELKKQYEDGLITKAGLEKSLQTLGVPDELDNIDLGDDI